MLEGVPIKETARKGLRIPSIFGECPKCSPKERTPTSTHGSCLDCGYQKFFSEVLLKRKQRRSY